MEEEQDEESEYLWEENSEAQSWIDQVKRRRKSGKYKDRKTSAGVSIYQVPECIKKTKPEAYDPVVVFLGPYHHKKHQQLTAMDDYKLQAVDSILRRPPCRTMKGLLDKVGELKKEIRDCYEDSAIEWDDNTLVWMMTMDACFILEFLRMDLPNSSLVFHFQRGRNIKRREIILDILKLENQIPLCILKKILELELNDPGAARDLLAKQLDRCIGGYFRGYPFSLKENEEENVEHVGGITENEKLLARLTENGALHLLDLSRQVIADFFSHSDDEPAMPVDSCACKIQCCTSTCITTPTRGPFGWFRSSLVIPSAAKLQRAGIKLKLSTDGKFKFKRRSFRRSTLSLPQITVEDYTEIFLRNLVAFEECQRHDNSPIKRVISLNMHIMDYLIDSKEDVALFQRANIIKNHLGTDDQVAQIFNDLCIGISYKDDFQHVLSNVNDHYNSQLNVWITEFRQEHCSKPWYIIPIVAAIILLVMSLLQTIYTI